MRKYAHETVVGVFVLIGLICVGYMAIKLGNVSLFGQDTYSLYARFTSISGLREGSPVKMFGIEVGQVAGYRMDQEDRVAVVEFRMNKKVKVFDDAIASIRTEGLIGDKYVSLDAGGSGDVLKSGDTIIDTESPTEIGELIGRHAFGNLEQE